MFLHSSLCIRLYLGLSTSACFCLCLCLYIWNLSLHFSFLHLSPRRSFFQRLSLSLTLSMPFYIFLSIFVSMSVFLSAFVFPSVPESFQSYILHCRFLIPFHSSFFGRFLCRHLRFFPFLSCRTGEFQRIMRKREERIFFGH